MPIQVLMPQLGESVVEGTINRWLKAKGEQITEFEPLLEVNTDKVDTEIPSPAAGTLLDILIPAGTTVNAGTLLAWIGEAGEALPEGGESAPVAMREAAEVPSPAPTQSLLHRLPVASREWASSPRSSPGSPGNRASI